MNKKYLTYIIIGVVLMFSGLSFAVANHLNNNGAVINAAYHRTTGALRIVNDGNLGPQEIPLSWNMVGPEGPQGPKGEPGKDADMESIEELLEEKFSGLLDLNETVNSLQARVLKIEQLLDLAPLAEIVGIQEVEDLVVEFGATSLAIRNALLPGEIEVILDSSATEILSVQWDAGSPHFEDYRTGSYLFTGTIELIEGIANSEGHQPVAEVTVREPQGKMTVNLDHDEGYVEISGLPEGEVIFEIYQYFPPSFTLYSWSIIGDEDGNYTFNAFDFPSDTFVSGHNAIIRNKEGGIIYALVDFSKLGLCHFLVEENWIVFEVEPDWELEVIVEIEGESEENWPRIVISPTDESGTPVYLDGVHELQIGDKGVAFARNPYNYGSETKIFWEILE